MFQRILSTSLSLLALFVLGTFLAEAGELTFEDRVQAQEAIERVYYSHQIGATEPFDRALSREILEHKVEIYLAQSAALDRVWHTPVTAVMLERELKRMASRTRMPQRLRELFAALNDDPLLIQECLARQVLVQRLSRNFFNGDPRIHAEARQEAEALRDRLAKGQLDPRAKHPARSIVILQRRTEANVDPRLTTEHDPDLFILEPEQFDRLRELAPRRVGAVSAVADEREAFTLRIVLEEQTNRATIAIYGVPKPAWDAWWSEAGAELVGMAVDVVAFEDLPLPRVATVAGRDCDDAWDNESLDDLPAQRSRHSAVWTGSRMIVWGGFLGNWQRQTGMLYDPATDSWTGMSVVDAPSARSGHVAVWTGEEMIVWGGSRWSNLGGRYDPISDTWRPTNREAPQARSGCSAVWTGEEMIVWGGYADAGVIFDSGGRYDPVSDTWVSTNSSSGPEPRGSHAAVWTGERMLIWGGWTDSGAVSTGWSYSPADDTWSPLSASGLSARTGARAVWTGEEMIVWGGTGPGQYERTGARYAPETNSWTPMALSGAPQERTQHTAVWTGSEMIVWGGAYGWLNTGGRYDPAADSWASTSTVGAPEGRTYHTAVWAGDRMIVWGGDSYGGGYKEYSTGGRYDPVSDSWTPTYNTGAPDARGFHSAVWTGNEMIVWGGGFWAGGDGLYINPVGTGSRYNPATDSWTPTSVSNAPDPRHGHTAVWSGSYMVVWGGESFSGKVNTGGRYEPISDTWGPVSLVGAPSERTAHTAVWTGSEMVVWGGSRSGVLSTGGRYDPWTDVWRPVSDVGAPAKRSYHSAVWTGDEMIIWGGYDYSASPEDLGTGGRYDPVGDSWSATQESGAPDGRFQHTAVWTGSEMIVWGGHAVYPPLDTGGRYTPETDSWRSTTTIDAPTARGNHTAVWVGNRMIIWGGSPDSGGNEAPGTGGRYDPFDDSWAPTSIVDAPSRRAFHTAVVADDTMMVWGGEGPLSDGGCYHPLGLDNDGDGFACALDCDDTDTQTYPGAPETNDGIDNQCPGDFGHGLVDETSGNSGFHNPDDRSEYSWPQQKSALGYEVARSTLADFSADCTIWPTTDTYVNDTEVPVAAGVFYYLNRSVAPHPGSWGQDSTGVERVDLCP